MLADVEEGSVRSAVAATAVACCVAPKRIFEFISRFPLLVHSACSEYWEIPLWSTFGGNLQVKMTHNAWKRYPHILPATNIGGFLRCFCHCCAPEILQVIKIHFHMLRVSARKETFIFSTLPRALSTQNVRTEMRLKSPSTIFLFNCCIKFDS